MAAFETSNQGWQLVAPNRYQLKLEKHHVVLRGRDPDEDLLFAGKDASCFMFAWCLAKNLAVTFNRWPADVMFKELRIFNCAADVIEGLVDNEWSKCTIFNSKEPSQASTVLFQPVHLQWYQMFWFA